MAAAGRKLYVISVLVVLFLKVGKHRRPVSWCYGGLGTAGSMRNRKNLDEAKRQLDQPAEDGARKELVKNGQDISEKNKSMAVIEAAADP